MGGVGFVTVFVIERFACGPTLVVTLAVLFEETGSATELETVALLVTLPVAIGAVMEMVSAGSELPLVSGPEFVQVIVEPDGAPQIQPVPVPVTGEPKPAGSVSVTVMAPLVESGPRLETSIV